MGVDLHVHLGPYIECTYRAAKREVDAYGCTNAECRKFKTRAEYPSSTAGKFCKECGSAIGVTKMEVEYRPHFNDVVVEDEFCDLAHDSSGPGRHNTFFLGPNRTRPGEPKTLAIKVDEGTHNDLSDIDIKAEIAWFEATYAVELKQLATAYDNVQVKWGVHSYFY